MRKSDFLIFPLMKYFNEYIFSMYSSSRFICRITTYCWLGNLFDFCGLQARCAEISQLCKVCTNKPPIEAINNHILVWISILRTERFAIFSIESNFHVARNSLKTWNLKKLELTVYRNWRSTSVKPVFCQQMICTLTIRVMMPIDYFPHNWRTRSW